MSAHSRRPADALPVGGVGVVEVRRVAEDLVDGRVRAGEFVGDGGLVLREHLVVELFEHRAQSAVDLDGGRAVLADLGYAECEGVGPATSVDDDVSGLREPSALGASHRRAAVR